MPQPKKHTGNAARQAAYRKRMQAQRLTECRQRGLPPHAAIPTMPSNARWNQILALASALLGMAVSEMTNYADACSEAWQESEKGEAFAERLETITQVSDQLDSAL